MSSSPDRVPNRWQAFTNGLTWGILLAVALLAVGYAGGQLL